MNGSGKTGNGRENNRRPQFRKRDKDSRQDAESQGRRPIQDNRNRGNNSEVKAASNNSGQKNLSARYNSNDASNQDKRNKGSGRHRGNRNSRNSSGASGRNMENTRPERDHNVDRPKWIPPKMNTDPLPVPDCSWCGKPIRDISQAINDNETESPVHFDCVTSKIAKTENLEKGDTITYIGGGRFGIVNFNSQRSSSRAPHGENNSFKIKKVIEWENREKKLDWRLEICEHYSVT